MSMVLFCVCLLLCVVSGYSVLYAMLAGLLIFIFHGRIRGFSWSALLRMTLSDVRTVRNVLLTFFLIGMLTALWRASGTIAAIVCYTTRFMDPSVFLLTAFLLNCGVSMLTGTALGTAATMGVICFMFAHSIGIDPVWTGGAILSGVFFGDRCSPVSTSALLVSALTRTDVYHNIRNMLRTGLVPFIISCIIYAAAGLLMKPSGQASDIRAVFESEFVISWITLLPAFLVLFLSLWRVNVKRCISISILASIAICLLIQGMAPGALLKTAISGYVASDRAAAAVINGGGLISMLKVALIVCISSAYSGLFRQAGLLDGMKNQIEALGRRISPFGATLCTAAVSATVACNQTLTIMLTHQLCGGMNPDPPAFANDLEDTAVIIAPLVPWSIASAVPLASMGAPALSILTACFLYLLPLWRVLSQRLRTISRKNSVLSS